MDFRTPKCNHSMKGRCFHCLTQQIKAEKKEEKQNKGDKKCTHPPNMRCLQCMPMGSNTGNSLCKHPDYEICSHCKKYQRRQTFQYYLSKLQEDCKHKKPCLKCVPPQSRKTFFVDKDCKNHIPYPQAQCDKCMAPTLSIQKQLYTHINKIIIKTTILNRLTEISNIGILVGHQQEDNIIVVEDIYFPQQVTNFQCLFPDTLSKHSQIFQAVNLKQVGLFYSSPQINPTNLMMSANFQEYCLQISQSGHPISKFFTLRLNYEDLFPKIQCFMLSDLVQTLQKRGLIFQTEEKHDYFQLISAKSQDSSSPTFLREGIQTNILYFRQAIVWIETIYEQNFTQDPIYIYPYFNIQPQNIHNLEIYLSIQTEDIIQKYHNIQFLLHLNHILGQQTVLIFLHQFIFEAPQLFLSQKIGQYFNTKKQIENDQLEAVSLSSRMQQ